MRSRCVFRCGSAVLQPIENSYLLAEILAQLADLPDCSYVNGVGLARLTLWKFSVNVRMGLNCVGDYAFQASDFESLIRRVVLIPDVTTS
jgi:hypothetical protein